jgi:hypothetical protein
MPKKTAPPLSPKQLMTLLKQGKVDERLCGAGVGQARLMELLKSLPPLEQGDETGLLARLERYHPDPGLSVNEYLILAYADDCVRQILKRASLDPRLEWLILRLIPHVALVAIGKGPAKLFDTSPVFGLMDQLCEHCIGWSSDLGVLGENSYEKIARLVEDISYQPKEQRGQLKELKEYFSSENKRFSARAMQFKRTEMQKLESAAARDRVARIINEEMAGERFPFFIVILLQGGWLNFVQAVLMDKGPDSKEWRSAQKLTRTLIWSLKDHSKDSAKEREKLYSVISDLPSRARALDRMLGSNTAQAENAIADIESEYEAIAQGDPSERGEYTPLEMQVLSSHDAGRSSIVARSNIEAKPGEWFLYEELDHEASRLKLILSWEKKQLLFSNYNHKNAIPIDYVDFCRSLAAGTISRLPLAPPCHIIVGEYAEQLLKNRQQKKAQAKKRKKAKAEAEWRKEAQAVWLKRAEAEWRKKDELERRNKVKMDKRRTLESARRNKEEQEAERRVAETKAGRSKLSMAERKAALAKEIEEIRKVESARRLESEKGRRAEEKTRRAEERKKQQAEEKKRQEEEKKWLAEERKRLEEEKKWLAEEKKKQQAEEKRRQEEEKSRQEEEERRQKEEERRQKEEKKRLEEEKKRQEAEKKKQDGEKKKQDAAKKKQDAEKKKRDAEKKRQEEEKKRQEEERKRQEEERKRAEERQRQAEEKKKREDEQRRQAEERKRQAEERIKEAEARIKAAEEQQRRAADEKVRLDEQEIQNANNAIEGIGVGAKIALESEADEVVICKLLTKMSNIDQYIFVDRAGIKVAQLSKQELVDLYLDRRLEILTIGEKFEDTLATVVRGLREDRDKAVAEAQM